jgi:hypothetical protein
MTISSRGAAKAVDKHCSPEVFTFTKEEGAFRGNLYASSPALYACHEPDNDANSRAHLRDCAAGHIDEADGTTEAALPLRHREAH